MRKEILLALGLFLGCTENNYYSSTAEAATGNADAAGNEADAGGGCLDPHHCGSDLPGDAATLSDGGRAQEDASSPEGSVDAAVDATPVADAGTLISGTYDVTVTFLATPNCIPRFDPGQETWVVEADYRIVAHVTRSTTQGGDTLYLGPNTGLSATLENSSKTESSTLSFAHDSFTGTGHRPGNNVFDGTACSINVTLQGVQL